MTRAGLLSTGDGATPHPGPATLAARARAATWTDVVAGWLAVRAALVLFVAVAGYLLDLDPDRRRAGLGGWLLDRFTWADSFHYLRIAERGYLPPGLPCCDQAFFPGYPLGIRAVSPLVGGNAELAGLVVAHLAGAVAAVLLWRLATELTGDPRVGLLAAGFLAVAPYGVFLGAVFTESLFLALALAAWRAASRRQWWAAGGFAGLATLVRVNGLFLAAGLAVLYAVQLHLDRSRAGPDPNRRPGLRADAAALLAPLLAVAGYVTYLYTRSGSWTAWSDAQATGWDRRNAWPWEGLVAGWQAIRGAPSADLLVAHTADLVTSLLGIALLATLLRLRRWPEATYVGLNVAVLVCSTTLQSAPRYALLWFPGYLLAAEVAVRRRWHRTVVATLLGSAAAMAALALALAAHLWVA